MATATNTKQKKSTSAEGKDKTRRESAQKVKADGKTEVASNGKIEFAIDKKALKKIRLVAVAYSYVEREMFATEDAYVAEVEVEGRAQQVLEALERIGLKAKLYPANQYLIP